MNKKTTILTITALLLTTTLLLTTGCNGNGDDPVVNVTVNRTPFEEQGHENLDRFIEEIEIGKITVDTRRAYFERETKITCDEELCNEEIEFKEDHHGKNVHKPIGFYINIKPSLIHYPSFPERDEEPDLSMDETLEGTDKAVGEADCSEEYCNLEQLLEYTLQQTEELETNKTTQTTGKLIRIEPSTGDIRDTLNRMGEQGLSQYPTHRWATSQKLMDVEWTEAKQIIEQTTADTAIHIPKDGLPKPGTNNITIQKQNINGVETYNITYVEQESIGDEEYRNIIFEEWTGDVPGSEFWRDKFGIDHDLPDSGNTTTRYIQIDSDELEEDETFEAIANLHPPEHFKEYHDLQINIEGEGQVDINPDQPEYEHGTHVTIVPEPAHGWKFQEWTGACENQGETCALEMTENKQTTAHFEKKTYTLEVNTEGEGTVDKDPDQPEYEHGETVTITARPDPGWKFTEWTGDNDNIEDTEAAETTINMENSYNIQAEFEEPKYYNNTKNMSKYSEKQAFLVSDDDWREVLTLVPVSIWTDNEENQIHQHPLLLYYLEEPSTFDADSMIHFLQQYNPSSLKIIDEAPEELNNLLIAEPPLGGDLERDQIDTIEKEDYLDHWSSYKEVVYVEDNYTKALTASTYASLINAPLIIEDYNDERSELVGREIICVGDVGGCDEEYTVDQLRKKYLQETETNKVILTNPNDLNENIRSEFQPKKSEEYITKLYGGASLAAPILASGKHELIYTTKNSSFEEVNRQFTTEFLDTYDYSQNDFNTIECKAGEPCSRGTEDYTIQLNQSTDTEIKMSFDLSNRSHSLDKIRKATLRNIHIPNECYEDEREFRLGEGTNITINGEETEPSLHIWDSRMVRDYEKVSIAIKEIKEEDLWNFTISIQNCNPAEIKEEELVLTLDYSDEDGSFIGRDRLYPISRKGMGKTTNITIDGIKPGGEANFTLDSLSPELDYGVVVEIPAELCRKEEEKYASYCWPHYQGREVRRINGSELQGDEVSIRVNATDFAVSERFGVPLLPSPSVRLIPFDSKDRYLTLLASPLGIQMSGESFKAFGNLLHHSKDFHYSTLNEEYLSHPRENKYMEQLYTGRIFGITPTDVSSHVNRNLFLSDLPRNRKGAFILRGTDPSATPEEVKERLNMEEKWGEEGSKIYQEFSESYECYSYDDPEVGCDTHEEAVNRNYINSSFTFYADHGSKLGIRPIDIQDKWLKPQVNIVRACSTCDFKNAKRTLSNPGHLFCAQNIRRGSLAYLGAQSGSLGIGPGYLDMVKRLFKENETIGKAHHNYKSYPGHYVLIGDPTVRPKYW